MSNVAATQVEMDVRRAVPDQQITRDGLALAVRRPHPQQHGAVFQCAGERLGMGCRLDVIEQLAQSEAGDAGGNQARYGRANRPRAALKDSRSANRPTTSGAADWLSSC